MLRISFRLTLILFCLRSICHALPIARTPSCILEPSEQCRTSLLVSEDKKLLFSGAASIFEKFGSNTRNIMIFLKKLQIHSKLLALWPYTPNRKRRRDPMPLL